MLSLSTIIMAYNEVNSLEGIVQAVDAISISLGCPYEIVIVDDGSTDGTAALADELAARLPHARVVHHRPNRGLGEVYRTGFAEAHCDVVIFIPADGQFPPQTITRFYELIQDHDLVLGYIQQRDDARVARLLSWSERLVYRLLFGSFPRFQGLLMFRRELLQQFNLHSRGRAWTVLMEFILRVYQSGRYRVVSEPNVFAPRAHGRSKVVNVKTIWESLKQVFLLRVQLWRE